jgi:hypothetical protein
MTGEPDDADSMVEPVGAELDRLADVVRLRRIWEPAPPWRVIPANCWEMN